MRKDLEHRLSRLERRKTAEVFKMIFVRGNTPEEHAAEKDRLTQAGLAKENDWFIFEPRGADQSSSKIVKLSDAAVRRLLREIQGSGKKIPEEAGKY
jgi:hypothetical protein